MAKKKKKEECPAGERWAVPYADFLSLLLALFIALYAISAVNISRVKALREEFVKIFEISPRTDAFQPVIELSPPPSETREMREGTDVGTADKQAMEVSVSSITELEQIAKQGSVMEQLEKGISLRLPARLLFESGKAEIYNADSLLFLKRIAMIAESLPPQTKINVQGHTDPDELKWGSPYIDSHGLASARSLAVLRELVKAGVPPSQLFASAYGEFKPISAAAREGKVLNRRVELFFFIEPGTPEQQKAIETILDKQPQP